MRSKRRGATSLTRLARFGVSGGSCLLERPWTFATTCDVHGSSGQIWHWAWRAQYQTRKDSRHAGVGCEETGRAHLPRLPLCFAIEYADEDRYRDAAVSAGDRRTFVLCER